MIWFKYAPYCSPSEWHGPYQNPDYKGSTDINTADCSELGYAAEMCAERLHCELFEDAWWPMQISLLESENGPELMKFTVERSVRPRFTAWISREK